MANQKVKFVAAKAIQAFQLIDEYNMVLFSWYYKGFKLLRRYLVKHGLRADLEDLNFEAIDKEMEADEAVVATDENLVEPEKGEMTLLWLSHHTSSSSFGVPYMFLGF